MRAVGRTVFIPGFLCLEECADAEGKRDEYRSSTANIHNDNIGADLPDIFERNNIFRFASE